MVQSAESQANASQGHSSGASPSASPPPNGSAPELAADCERLRQELLAAQAQVLKTTADLLAREEELQHARRQLQQGSADREALETRMSLMHSRIQPLLDHSEFYLMQADSEGCIRYLSHPDPAVRVDQVLGTKLTDWAIPEDRLAVRNAIERVVETRQPVRYYSRAWVPTMGLRWYDSRMVPWIKENQVVGVSMLAADVTGARALQAELEKQQRTLSAILEHMPVGILVVSSTTGRPLLWNRRLQEMGGHAAPPQNDGLGQFIAQFRIHRRGTTDLYPLAEFPLTKALQGQMCRAEDLELHRADGSAISLEVFAAPVSGVDGQQAMAMAMIQDVTDRKLAEQRLLHEQNFLRNLIRVHERDRQLTAYEIHDGLVQDITAAMMHLEGFSETLPLASQQNPAWKLTLELLRKSIGEARRVLSGLRPPILDEQGIVMAIRYLAAEHSSDDLHVTFVADVNFDRLDRLLEGAIFRIVQESLNNVRRHSGAKEATVTLEQVDDSVRLRIQDSGVGFDPSQVPKERFGLQGIIKRANLVGGAAIIDSRPGAGTTIQIELPFVPDEADALPAESPPATNRNTPPHS